MRKRWILLAPLVFLAFLAFVAVGGVIVQQLWNWLLPPLFGWHELSFWQALGMLALCRILFGGLGLHGSGRSGFRRRMGERMQERMAERMEERMASMTPEERERLRQRMRERWGVGPAASEDEER
jgi:hypothetical protein